MSDFTTWMLAMLDFRDKVLSLRGISSEIMEEFSSPMVTEANKKMGFSIKTEQLENGKFRCVVAIELEDKIYDIEIRNGIQISMLNEFVFKNLDFTFLTFGECMENLVERYIDRSPKE